MATDGDGDILTYTLVAAPEAGDDDVEFAIDRATGQLMTKGKLDFETAPVLIIGEPAKGYVVVVRATDPDGMPEADARSVDDSDEITVTITVTGVDEAPDVSGMGAVSFIENDEISMVLDMYTAIGPGGGW